jgi:hypothetical protein
MDTLLTRKLKFFSTNLGHVILSRVMTLEIKVLEKIELYNKLYNCLLCIIIVQLFSKSITYSKEFFSWPKLSGGVKKGWNQNISNLDMEKMSTLIPFQGFLIFVQCFMLENILNVFLKWTLQLMCLVHPTGLSP